MFVTDDIKYVGVNDHKVDLFEGQYDVPNGMSYNSYVILDEKICITDTADGAFVDEWMKNVKAVLGEKTPDYLVVHHMEPDHSMGIKKLMEEYPSCKVVSSKQAFVMMMQFFGTDFKDRQVVVKEGDVLSLGKHALTFVGAPMVHWPEVLVSYDSADKVLFSADGFGKFGALDKEEEWEDEARRYYIGIVGKFGVNVQNLLKKASGLDIKIIAPLHGPVLKDNLGYYLGLYDKWSSYTPTEDAVVIAYASVYGNTKAAAMELAYNLESLGKKAYLFDLSRCDMHEAVSYVFKCSKLVLASITYNTGIFPAMREFINDLLERNYQNRVVGTMENGCWGPMATKVMKEMFANAKNITFTEANVKIKSKANAANMAEIGALASELAK